MSTGTRCSIANIHAGGPVCERTPWAAVDSSEADAPGGASGFPGGDLWHAGPLRDTPNSEGRF